MTFRELYNNRHKHQQTYLDPQIDIPCVEAAIMKMIVIKDYENAPYGNMFKNNYIEEFIPENIIIKSLMNFTKSENMIHRDYSLKYPSCSLLIKIIVAAEFKHFPKYFSTSTKEMSPGTTL